MVDFIPVRVSPNEFSKPNFIIFAFSGPKAVEKEYRDKVYKFADLETVPQGARYYDYTFGKSDTILVRNDAYLFFYVDVGSSKHRYHEFCMVLKPREGARVEVETGGTSRMPSTLTVENAEVVITSRDLLAQREELEAWLLSQGFYVKPPTKLKGVVMYDPQYFKALVHAYLTIQAERSKQQLGVEEEFIQATTASQPTQPSQQSTVELEEELELAPAAPQPTQPSKPSLVKLYVLSFDLPSGYLGTKEIKKNATDEHRTFDARVKSVLEGFRVKAYSEMRRAFHSTSLGWIAVSDEAIAEATRLNEAAKDAIKSALSIPDIPDVVKQRLERALERRFFKAIPVYLEIQDAKEILEEAIRSMSEDIKELNDRIQAAKYESQRRQLASALADLERKLAQFQAKLKEL